MAEDAEDADIDEDAFDDMTGWRRVQNGAKRAFTVLISTLEYLTMFQYILPIVAPFQSRNLPQKLYKK